MHLNLQLIKEKRKKLKFNTSQMAIFLNLSNASQYWKREKGHYKFKPNELAIISDKLEIPFDHLFLSNQYSKMEYENDEGGSVNALKTD